MTPVYLLTRSSAFIALALLSAPTTVAAQTEETPSIDSPEQCALIDDGIKRLACFDSLYKPKERQAQAPESAKEQAEKIAEHLAPNCEDLDAVAGNGLGERPERIPFQPQAGVHRL